MNYQAIVSMSAHILNNNPHQAIMVWGPPGCGKSHAMTQALPTQLGLPTDAVMMFRPSNHDPVDVTGLPVVTEDRTRWSPPDFLLKANEKAEQYGRSLLVIDEINQSVPMMFNILNGLILDRHVSAFHLHPGVHIVATGNRQTDKAASNRMPAHTANRLCHFDMESDLNGFTKYWLSQDLPIWVISYINMKPNNLNAFNPDERCNPTERSWELFAKAAGDDLPLEMTATLAKSFLGEGVAAELAAFRKIESEMPNPDGCLIDPKGSALPTSIHAKYAIAGALAQRANKGNFDAVLQYMGRIEKQFEVLCVRIAFGKKPEVLATKAGIQWAADNANVFAA